MAITVSLRRPYSKRICSIFSPSKAIKCLGEIYKQNTLRYFCMFSFDNLTNCQNLRSCRLISLKTILIFPKNFCNFRLDMIEKLNIINLSSYSSKSYASLVLSNSEVTFLGKGRMQLFIYFILVFCLNTLSHNQRDMLLKDISPRPVAFVSSSLLVCFLFLHRLKQIFDKTTLWLGKILLQKRSMFHSLKCCLSTFCL